MPRKSLCEMTWGEFCEEFQRLFGCPPPEKTDPQTLARIYIASQLRRAPDGANPVEVLLFLKEEYQTLLADGTALSNAILAEFDTLTQQARERADGKVTDPDAMTG